jgi:transaldolase
VIVDLFREKGGVVRKGYFQRVNEQTPTRFWINNPTAREAEMAITAGATGCTCNPSFCQKMLDHPEGNEWAWQQLDQAVAESADDSQAVSILQRRLATPILERFRRLYEEAPDRNGYVSLQGDPILEHDPDVILKEAFENRAVAENVCVKVPVTASGLEAIQILVEENVPVNSTEIFGVSQAVSLCEAYAAASRRSGKKPIMFLSHIAGIYDDYLQGYVKEHQIDISPDVLWQAGLAVARRVYDLIQQRGYPVIMIGGGARGAHHFTEMVGGDLVVTINWTGMADQLLASDPPVVNRMFYPVPQRVVDELMEKLPDFRRGWLEDGLSVEEYEDFGPVRLFRNAFVTGWERVTRLAAERRSASHEVSPG